MPRESARHSNQQLATTASEFYGSVGERVSQSQTAFAQGFQALQQEAMNFANRRLEQTVGFMEQYRKCRNMSDVLALQQRWLLELGQDYYFQGMKLAQTLGTTVSDELEVADATQHEIAEQSDQARKKIAGKGVRQARRQRTHRNARRSEPRSSRRTSAH